MLQEQKYFKLLWLPLLAVLVVGACKREQKDTGKDKFVLTDTMMKRCGFLTVQKKPVKGQLKLFGKITAENSRLAQVYPVMGGSVIKINVELGDSVQQGQVLASVRSGDVAQLKKDRLDASSNLALAEKNLQVARDLYEGKLTSEKEVKAAESETEKARAEVDRINEVYNIFQLNGATTYNILAPIKGFVVEKNINQNELLRSDKSDVIFSIAQIDEVWAVANVNESDISRVKVGYEAIIQTIAYPDRFFYGKIDKVLSAIDPETKAMKAIVRIQNSDLQLKPEMNTTISLNYLEGQSLVAIPSSAIIFDKSKNWVMVFHARDNIETRQVKVYSTIDETAYITAGLDEGEKIITRNGLLVYDALND